MYCPKCGAQNNDNVSICKNCGEVIEPSGVKPADNLTLAIISTVVGALCSCFGVIPGIVAIVYAAQVNNKWSLGDFAGAESASKNAKTWSYISFGLSAVALLIFVSGAISTFFAPTRRFGGP